MPSIQRKHSTSQKQLMELYCTLLYCTVLDGVKRDDDAVLVEDSIEGKAGGHAADAAAAAILLEHPSRTTLTHRKLPQVQELSSILIRSGFRGECRWKRSLVVAATAAGRCHRWCCNFPSWSLSFLVMLFCCLYRNAERVKSEVE